ncbi:hypothetical protein [Butyrivibrio sp.]|jgi:hypothetical protein|uniref:hypothetical protein n=1 Tax=Butyrivibrio sp. TaxID=28121 RepID=UPI0025C1994B|nr:hypothetical protein [Butyrivibrio sp.]MBE5837092.1 hypothetical protein [Butyrivibrio sp.]
MVIIDNQKYGEAIKRIGNAGSNARVNWSLNMFREAENVIADYEYALVTNNEGEDIAVLAWYANSYVHSYKYNGDIDLEFLNGYKCLFLFGCNEYSVELCRTALDKWTGKRLVFVGEDWKYVIDLLPELLEKECIWEDALDQELMKSLSDGMTYLQIKLGIPGEEPMARYENHIMTYDEVMAFTYLFSDKEDFGERNPDKKFWVFDAHYGNLGIFNVFNKSFCCMKYAKKKGYIPIPILTDSRGLLGIYQDSKDDDFWKKFYEYPDGYTPEDIRGSKNVYFAPFFYNATIMQKLMDKYSEGVEITWPKGIYNKRVLNYIREREDKFLPYPEKTLGVLARGTDYVNTHLSNHSIHATKEMIAQKIDECLNKWNLDFIYLATEDASYCDFFKEKYGDKICFTDQERFTVNKGQLLGDMHRNNPDKREGFLLGAEYILSITLLSRCSSLIASGGCAGLGETKKMNGGRYKNIFVFNLGTNK